MLKQNKLLIKYRTIKNQVFLMAIFLLWSRSCTQPENALQECLLVVASHKPTLFLSSSSIVIISVNGPTIITMFTWSRGATKSLTFKNSQGLACLPHQKGCSIWNRQPNHRPQPACPRILFSSVSHRYFLRPFRSSHSKLRWGEPSLVVCWVGAVADGMRPSTERWISMQAKARSLGEEVNWLILGY